MGDKNNSTQDNVGSSNCHRGYKAHEDISKNGVADTHSIYTSPLAILVNQNEWPSGSARFFIQDCKSQGGGLIGLVFNSVVD